MGRKPCCDKAGLKRGPWTIEEDYKLVHYILSNGIQCWRHVPKLAGLLRCGKSCRLRWINYLRPDLKRGAFSEAEEDQIIELHGLLGNRWSKIASHFPGRTDNEIKNHWNTRIKKMLKLRGIDPLTHKPIEPKSESEDSDMKLHDEQEREITDASRPGNADVENISSYKSETSMTKDYNKSPSFKPEDSVTCPSSGLEESNMNAHAHDEYDSDLLQWVDNLDSLFSWDVINQLDDNIFLTQL